jgi:hypothetical protein
VYAFRPREPVQDGAGAGGGGQRGAAPLCQGSVADLDPDPDPSGPDLPNVFLSLLDPDPDPLVRGMDPDPGLDPSIIKQNRKENRDFYCFVTSF